MKSNRIIDSHSFESVVRTHPILHKTMKIKVSNYISLGKGKKGTHTHKPIDIY